MSTSDDKTVGYKIPQYKGKTVKQYADARRAKNREYWLLHDPYEKISKKKCTHCKRLLDSKGNFDLSKADKDGLQSWCRGCSRQRYEEHPAYHLLTNAKMRAKRLGLKFSLTISDIIVPSICPVLGIPIKVGIGQSNGSPTIDRFDNLKGYTPDNIRVISWRANNLKSNANVTEMELILKYMKGQCAFEGCE